MIVLALLLQAAAGAAPVTRVSAAPPERFSILLDDCEKAAAAGSHDVVVCGNAPNSTQRLPLPDDAPPTPGYVKPDSGGYRDNRGGGGSCAALQGGCQVGFGPPIMPVVAAGVRGVGNALANRQEAKARARDGARRQPIDLGAAPAGRLEP